MRLVSPAFGPSNSVDTTGDIAQYYSAKTRAFYTYIAAGTTLTLKYLVTKDGVAPLANTQVTLQVNSPYSGSKATWLSGSTKIGIPASESALGADLTGTTNAAGEVTFNLKNTNASIDQSLERFRPVLARANADGVHVRGYVSTVLGCPYQGDVPIADVVRVARQLHALGCYEISLGDTIGIGTPGKARAMLRAVAAEVPIAALAIHFHDTRGQALANILACLEEGVAVVDAAVSGTGGCPYAPGASGNVATEDVVYMLEGMGIATGVDLPRLVDTGRWLAALLGRGSGSKVTLAAG